MSFTYYWKHRAQIKAREIDDLLQDALGKAQDLIALIEKANVEERWTARVDYDLEGMHDSIVKLSNEYSEIAHV